MVSLAVVRASFGAAATLLATNCDAFNGALLNSRGKPLICTLFATPKRRRIVLRGATVDSNAPLACVEPLVTVDVAVVITMEFDSTVFFDAIPLSCGRANFDMPCVTVEAVGRAKPLGFGIRVTTDDEPLSKRGIFVCFSSYAMNIFIKRTKKER